MNRSDAPKKQAVPFGLNGPREPLLTTTPAGDNTASYDSGFPSVTMILKAAGGLPPKGQDMNQILFELSAIGRWLSAGALNGFDATFSLSIGGYPKGSILTGDDGSSIYISTLDNNNNNPNSSQAGWINLAKILSMAGLSGGPDKIPYFSGVNSASQTDFTPVGRSVVGQTSIANLLSYLGVSGGLSPGSIGRLIGIKRYTSSSNYTKTPGAMWGVVTVIGGGGGGGGCQSTASGYVSAASGGGAAGMARSLIDLSSITSVTITIGTGGVGGTYGSSNPGNGGVSSFGSYLQATGGLGGINTQTFTAGSTVVVPNGGVGQGFSGNLINAIGGSGTPAIIAQTGYESGGGGQSFFSGGGVPTSTNVSSSGNDGNLGSGGGGAFLLQSSTARSGGRGGDGIIIIEEYA